MIPLARRLPAQAVLASLAASLCPAAPGFGPVTRLVLFEPVLGETVAADPASGAVELRFAVVPAEHSAMLPRIPHILAARQRPPFAAAAAAPCCRPQLPLLAPWVYRCTAAANAAPPLPPHQAADRRAGSL